MSTRLAALGLWILTALPAAAAPPTVTLPAPGTYSWWVRERSGAVAQMPMTVKGKAITVGTKAVPGDTLYVLDSHTGRIASHLLLANPQGEFQPLSLSVNDFQEPTGTASAPANPAASPAPAKSEDASDNGIARLITLMLGLAVLGGVAWVIRRLIANRGADLIALARKAGVEVPDPAKPDEIGPEKDPVYTPPAPRPLEKIPDEAGLAVTPRVPEPPSLPAGHGPALVGIQGIAAGSVFALPVGEITLGRDGDNHIVLAETLVSRRHAQIVRDGAGIVLQDLNSSNGVRVNGERVSRAVLQPGDQIEIGDNLFRFEA